jgi:hypothetical protein
MCYLSCINVLLLLLVRVGNECDFVHIEPGTGGIGGVGNNGGFFHERKVSPSNVH